MAFALFYTDLFYPTILQVKFNILPTLFWLHVVPHMKVAARTVKNKPKNIHQQNIKFK